MTPTEKSLTMLAAWFLFAIFAGPLLARFLFTADRREIGANEASDTLPTREHLPLEDAAFEVVYGEKYAAWQQEVQAHADSELAQLIGGES